MEKTRGTPGVALNFPKRRATPLVLYFYGWPPRFGRVILETLFMYHYMTTIEVEMESGCMLWQGAVNKRGYQGERDRRKPGWCTG